MLNAFIKVFHAFWLLGHWLEEFSPILVALIDSQWSSRLAFVVLLQILLVLIALALLTGDNPLWVDAWGRSWVVITHIAVIALSI